MADLDRNARTDIAIARAGSCMRILDLRRDIQSTSVEILSLSNPLDRGMRRIADAYAKKPIRHGGLAGAKEVFERLFSASGYKAKAASRLLALRRHRRVMTWEGGCASGRHIAEELHHAAWLRGKAAEIQNDSRIIGGKK